MVGIHFHGVDRNVNVDFRIFSLSVCCVAVFVGLILGGLSRSNISLRVNCAITGTME